MEQANSPCVNLVGRVQRHLDRVFLQLPCDCTFFSSSPKVKIDLLVDYSINKHTVLLHKDKRRDVATCFKHLLLKDPGA